ncbi:hypothetical protein F5Y13DRAFT_198183 [Hypoxylon sp. FL1857]|nr:hypothetical protein F5Y13DRAFT_198183 [Hypoxylon sp. FL1857]
MTRKLPWKQAERSLARSPKSTASTPAREVKIKRDGSDVDEKKSAASSVSNKRIKTSRSESATPSRIPRVGSTSPPPEPLPESYMIEGLENDDLYRMVEDEFLSTAQQFTAHLHAAEYHRLKAASKSQNADTIRNISRPVVGRMSDLVKKKQDRKTRFEKQKEATRKALANKGQSNDDTESKDDPWQTASLYGLMEKPRQQATRLDNLTKVTTTTRAAAGFNPVKSPSSARTRPTLPGNIHGSRSTKPAPKETSETEDDDDNIAIPSPSLRTRPNQRAPPSTSHPPGSAHAHNATRDILSLRHPTKPAHPTVQKSESEATPEIDDSEDSHGDFLARLKRRQEERKRNREQRKLAAATASTAQPKPKKTTEDIIPGFL